MTRWSCSRPTRLCRAPVQRRPFHARPPRLQRTWNAGACSARHTPSAIVVGGCEMSSEAARTGASGRDEPKTTLDATATQAKEGGPNLIHRPARGDGGASLRDEIVTYNSQ